MSMKLIILAALVSTCICWPWQSAQTSVEENIDQAEHLKYWAGNVYEYEYKSQVLTGLPTFSKQYSGIKFICNISLSVENSEHMVLQMKNVKLYSLNSELEKIEYLPPTMQLSENLFQELPTDQRTLINRKLTLPIQFLIQDYKVVSLKISDGETNWSIDIKRSVLAMLQVRLKSPSSSTDQRVGYNDISVGSPTTFDVDESGLEGECYSTLHVYMPRNAQSNQYRVTKVRDESSCMKRNVNDKNAYQQQQSNCDCRGNLLNKQCICSPVSSYWNATDSKFTQSRTEYEVVSGNVKDLIIKKAVQTVENRLEAPNAPNKYVLTTSNQTLIMRGHKALRRSPVHNLAMSLVPEPWKMQILKDELEKKMMTGSEITSNIEKLLAEIEAASLHADRLEDHMVIFYQLSSNVKLCSKAELETLFAKLKRDASKPGRFQTYLDALKVANTFEADSLLISKIKDKQLTTFQATCVLIQWTSEKVPTLETLDYFLSNLLPLYYQDIPGFVTTYKHTMLCLGSMVRRYIQNEEIKMDQSVFSADKVYHQMNIDRGRKYEKYVEGRLAVSSDEAHTVIALKTFANMGSINSLSTLIQKYMGSNQSTIVRIEAVNALINLGVQNQLQVVQALMPVMMNAQEEISVRVAAFTVLMKCRSNSPLLELERYINVDKDLEFKTFVVRYLKNVLELNEPKYRQHHMRIRQTLKTIRAFRMSEATRDWQVLFELKNKGDLLKATTVRANNAGIPQFASFGQYTKHRNQLHHLYEFGFRAEGMTELMKPKFQRSKQNRREQPLLQKPSLTFYIKVLGQEVSVTHFDSNNLMAMLKAFSMKNGELKFPVKIFQTMLLQPRRIRSLQPHGGYLVQEHAHVAVVDFEGNVTVLFGGRSKLPYIIFESSKQYRTDVMTYNSQHVDMGFLKTGIHSSMTNRAFTKSQKSVVTYDMQTNDLVFNVTVPSNLYSFMEMHARTVTFTYPNRLPVTMTSFSGVCKELKVDEKDRLQVEKEIPALKSINMEGKVTLDVNMPELYSFVRDRLHLLPTVLSTYKQRLRLSYKPATSSIHTISTQLSSRRISQNGKEVEANNLSEFLFSKKQLSISRWVKSKPGGQLVHQVGVSMATVSNSQVLKMGMNFSTFTDSFQNNSDAYYYLEVEHPPIQPEESEPWKFVDSVNNKFMSATDEIVQNHRMSWGPRYPNDRCTLDIKLKYSPDYIDYECHQMTAYGCKNDYGVIYPLWYRNSMDAEATNTDILKQAKQLLKPLLKNFAESVYVSSSQAIGLDDQKARVEFVVRPMENKFDFLVYDEDYQTNFTGVYDPVSTKIHQYLTESKQPIEPNPIGMKYLETGITEYQCSLSKHKLLTFDSQSLHLPTTDCEVLLTGSCGNHHNNFNITMVPESNLLGFKELTIINGSQVIKVQADDYKIVDVTIDGVKQVKKSSYNGGRKFLLSRSKDGYLDWDDSGFKWNNIKIGTNIEISENGFSLWVDALKIFNFGCGVCKHRPNLPQEPLSNSEVKDIVREESISGECSIGEPVDTESVCHKDYKYIMKFFGDVCITEEPQPVCNNRCSKKVTHLVTVKALCFRDDVIVDDGKDFPVESSSAIRELMTTVDYFKDIQISASQECS